METENVDGVESFPDNFSYKGEVVVLGERELILISRRDLCIFKCLYKQAKRKRG